MKHKLFTWPRIKTRPLLSFCPFPWLKAKAARAKNNKWYQLVTAGHVLRFWPQALSAHQLAQVTADYCEGKVPKAWQAVRDAFAHFHDDDFSSVAEYLVCSLFILHDELFELKACIDPDNPTWRRAYIRWCEALDDTFAVYGLIAFLGHAAVLPPVDAVLEDLAHFSAITPKGLDPYNPQLLCALAYDPTCPWTAPVEDPAWSKVLA